MRRSEERTDKDKKKKKVENFSSSVCSSFRPSFFLSFFLLVICQTSPSDAVSFWWSRDFLPLLILLLSLSVFFC